MSVADLNLYDQLASLVALSEEDSIRAATKILLITESGAVSFCSSRQVCPS